MMRIVWRTFILWEKHFRDNFHWTLIDNNCMTVLRTFNDKMRPCTMRPWLEIIWAAICRSWSQSGAANQINISQDSGVQRERERMDGVVRNIQNAYAVPISRADICPLIQIEWKITFVTDFVAGHDVFSVWRRTLMPCSWVPQLWCLDVSRSKRSD